jgi:hypothetical protein
MENHFNKENFRMRRQIIRFVLILFTICITSAHAQIIIKTVKEYVLIDTDTNIGSLNEKIRVYRLHRKDVIDVGQIQIVKFKDGKTAAKIIKENRGFRILKGDFVSEKKKTGFGYSQSASSGQISKSNTKTPVKALQKTDRLGVHIGRFLPSSHLENDYLPCYTIGGYIRLIRIWNHSFFINATVPLLKMAPDRNMYLETNMFFLNVVDHIRVGKRIHFDVGGGLYYYKWENPTTGESGSDSYTGFSLGLSLDFFSPIGITLSPMIRCHTYLQDDEWREFIVGGMNLSYSF